MVSMQFVRIMRKATSLDKPTGTRVASQAGGMVLRHAAPALLGTILTGVGLTCATGRLNTLGGLSYTPPPGFRLVGEQQEEVPSPIPDDKPSVERFRSYQDSAGRTLALFCWERGPFRDYGPIEVEQEQGATVAGEPARLCRTSLFFGLPQKVLVAYFADPEQRDRSYMVYLTGSGKDTAPEEREFAAFLDTVRFEGR